MLTKIIRTLILTLSICLYSCKSEREKKVEKINIESRYIIRSAINEIKESGKKINVDSLYNFYTKIASDSAELGLEYANKIQVVAKTITDSINVVNDIISENSLDSIAKVNAIARKVWDNSKAGKIQKKHPDWSDEDCLNIVNHKIWIGMSIDMLKYERGNPNSANPSNYGSGVNWQWCWDDYTPSCFYGGSDKIITSYN